MDFCAKRYNAVAAIPTDGKFCEYGLGWDPCAGRAHKKTKKPPWSFQGGLASVAVGQALIAFALHPLAHQLADAAG